MHRQPLSPEHRMRIGATQLGITLDEYRARVKDGDKWCFGCRSWRPRGAFQQRTSAADGLNNECRDCVNPRARAIMARRRREAAHGR